METCTDFSISHGKLKRRNCPANVTTHTKVSPQFSIRKGIPWEFKWCGSFGVSTVLFPPVQLTAPMFNPINSILAIYNKNSFVAQHERQQIMLSPNYSIH